MKRHSLFIVIIAFFTYAGSGITYAAELRPFHRGDFAGLISANRGQAVIINFWSVTCPPCLAEMPTLKKFSEQHPSLRLELVSTDSIEDETRIRNALDRHGFGAQQSWAFAEAHKTRLRYDIDKTWRGELPRTYFVARNGHVVGFSGMLDPTYLETWMQDQK